MTAHDLTNIARAVLASLSLLLLGIETPVQAQTIGATLWVVTYAWTSKRVLFGNGWALRRNRVGTYVPVRLVLLSGLLLLVITRLHPGGYWGVLPNVVALLLVTTLEGLLRKVYLYPSVRVSGLAGIQTRERTEVLFHTYLIAAILGPVGIFALILSGLPGDGTMPWVLLSIVPILSVIAIAFDAVLRRHVSRIAFRDLPRVLDEHAAEFVLYWDAPRGSVFQVSMWLPYLKRIGLPFFIIVRRDSAFDEVVELDQDIAVVLARSMSDLDRLMVESITTAFYVNNGMRNSHLVRFPEITHVQLLHGDSDKAPSYNPVTGMFDLIYVAGQAGIDRYRLNGVKISEDKFAIVGRPQVEAIQRGAVQSSIERFVVLYAPTWRGYYDDSSYSSLPLGKKLFEYLLKRNVSIIFRPHPYCWKDPEFRIIIQELHDMLKHHSAVSGVQHIFGQRAEQEMSIIDCFNASDVMISDVSSVVIDYLQSEKPLALMSPTLGSEEFRDSFPVAPACYILTSDESFWDKTLDDLLIHDPLRSIRIDRRAYYLGDLSADNYADVFVRTARNQVGLRKVGK